MEGGGDVAVAVSDDFARRFDLDVNYIVRMWSARFCLVPRGARGPDTPRLLEALRAGCVPVVVAQAHLRTRPQQTPQ